MSVFSTGKSTVPISNCCNTTAEFSKSAQVLSESGKSFLMRVIWKSKGDREGSWTDWGCTRNHITGSTLQIDDEKAVWTSCITCYTGECQPLVLCGDSWFHVSPLCLPSTLTYSCWKVTNSTVSNFFCDVPRFCLFFLFVFLISRNFWIFAFLSVLHVV